MCPLASFINVISKTFGKSEDEEKCVTIDELKMLVEFSEKQGIVDREERSMIHGILDFKRVQVKGDNASKGGYEFVRYRRPGRGAY